MSRLRHAGERSANVFIEKGHKTNNLVQVLAGALVLTSDYPPVLFLDPGGASRNVDLPVAENGLRFEIWNEADAIEDLVVRVSGGASTVITLSQNQMGLVVAGADGNWRRMLGSSLAT